jgi:hypothetical protein
MVAQIAPGWSQCSALGSDIPGMGAWYGAGLWAGDHHAAAPTLTDSLGMGNALTGEGFHLEAGYRVGHWDMAAEVLANRDDRGAKYLTLYKSHVWYRGDKGWQGGFEQEPLVWGYGLNGGYLLGEAARPFPRLRTESPMAALHLGPVPLGTWGWQAFMGRMENHPVLSSSVSDPSFRSRLLAANGTPEAPLLMGYRVQAEFGPLMELYLNYLNLWSGTLNGRGMTSGYNLGDFATAITGLKDTLAEANSNNFGTYKNNARSASEADVGFRLKVPALAQSLDADTAQVYISRGSKSTAWLVGTFVKNPARYLTKDVTGDMKNLVKGDLGASWTQNGRYSAPTLAYPNDTIGVQLSWSKVRAGLEYIDCVNPTSTGFRPFTNSQYVTGFYYYGDPLGTPEGGEFISTTAKVEVDITPRMTSTTSITRGFRPFRDYLPDWQLDHPDRTPGKDRFTALQQTLRCKAGVHTTVEAGASWQREEAVNNVVGQEGNGFAWFTDVSFRWPAPRR